MKAAKAATAAATRTFFMAAMFLSQRLHWDTSWVFLQNCARDGASVWTANSLQLGNKSYT